MNLEVADYFVIVRGAQLNTEPIWAGFGFEPDKRERPVHYDRSWIGCLFQVIETNGDSVTARIVGIDGMYPHKRVYVGKVAILSLPELNVMPVGKATVDAILEARP